MLRASSVTVAVALCLAALGVPLMHAQQQQQGGGRIPSIDDRTAGMQKIDGYFPLYWDERTGALFIEIPRLDTEFLFSTGLAAGLGSNDIGLDRGSGGGGRVVYVPARRAARHARAAQPVVPLEQRQPARAQVGRRLVREVDPLGLHRRRREQRPRARGRHRLPAARRASAPANALRPGNYRVDRTRSAFYLPRTKGFPKNTEIEMTLTFANEAAGGRGGGGGPAQGPPPIGAAGGGGGGGRGGGLFSGSVASVTPTPDAVTLREHVSLVELPDNNYKPRYDDPRAGYGGLSYVDYSAPIGEPMVMRFIRRHRLEKKDPSAAVSEPVKPIQYWVDSGAPEDVRKALLEGASWWNQAFEAAGFRNAFKVDVLPEGADPMDIRYNMINWVHRSTRGWSSGGTVTDPRTGEIIKATVTLGSLRDRQDYMIFEGLLSPYTSGIEQPAVLYEDGAQAHPPARRARGRPHARPRPQLLRQRKGLDLGDGLSASAREAERGRHHRSLRGVPGAHRRLGQGDDQLRLSPVPGRHRRESGARENPGRCVERRICGT